MGFVGGGGNVDIATALPQSSCVLYCKHQIVHGIFISYFLCLPEASVSGCGATDVRGLAAGNLSDLTVASSRYDIYYCCTLRLWSQICVTCRSDWFPDLVVLLCCEGAGCLGPEGWRHMQWMDMEHLENPSLSVVVVKCWCL